MNPKLNGFVREEEDHGRPGRRAGQVPEDAVEVRAVRHEARFDALDAGGVVRRLRALGGAEMAAQIVRADIQGHDFHGEAVDEVERLLQLAATDEGARGLAGSPKVA